MSLVLVRLIFVVSGPLIIEALAPLSSSAFIVAGRGFGPARVRALAHATGALGFPVSGQDDTARLRKIASMVWSSEHACNTHSLLFLSGTDLTNLLPPCRGSHLLFASSSVLASSGLQLQSH